MARPTNASKAKPPRNAAAREMFDNKILQLLAMDLTVEDVAKRLKLSPAIVSGVAEKSLEKFRELNAQDIATIRGKEIAQLEYLKSEALKNWEETKDVSSLNALVRIRERAAKVQGLDQPIEMRHVHTRYNELRDIVVMAVMNVFGNDSEHLDKLIKEIDRLEVEYNVGGSDLP